MDNLAGSLAPNGRLILCEEINQVFHGSERLFEDDDYRLSETRALFKGEAVAGDCVCVENFFQKYHELRAQFGVPYMRVNGQILHGDQSPAERYLRGKGFAQKTISGPNMAWLKPHSFEDIVYSIENAIVTTLGSDMPESVRKKTGGELRKFCAAKGFALNRTMGIPSQIQLHVFEMVQQ